MDKVRIFAGCIALAALVGNLTIGAFLYHQVAPGLLPWWAIAAGFTFLAAVLSQLTKGGE